MTHTEFDMVAKTFKGLEDVLAQELTELGANNIQIQRRAVTFTGDTAMMYRANFCLRTATRVLVPIASFFAKDSDRIYQEAKKVDWDLFMNFKTTFAIDATIYSETFRHSQYVTYRVKDAIADYWMEKEGRRPNVRLTDPDLFVNIHIAGEQVTLSLDSSGESLHKRGYRVSNTEAPINEALAAGLLLKAGWNGQSDFFDPMCGSGTLLIEAALIAHHIAPGIYRKEFAFEKWPDFDANLLEQIYNDDSRETAFTHHIYGSDASFYAVNSALKNIQSSNLSRDISVRQIRIEELSDTNMEGTTKGALVMMNPPYGERLAQNKDILHLYSAMGTALKHHFEGATAWVISSNEDAMHAIGLKPTRRIHLLNGELDCLFNQYELFQGDHKTWKKSTSQTTTTPSRRNESPSTRSHSETTRNFSSTAKGRFKKRNFSR